MLAPWKKSYDQPRQHIKKQRHYFAIKGPSSQGYGFSRSHVWIWELDYKESITEEVMLFNCGVGEYSWASLGLQRDPTVNPKGNQPWIFIGSTEAEAEAPIRAYSLERTLIGKDWKQEEKVVTEDEMAGWHHQLSGHEFEQTPGDSEEQGKPSVLQSMKSQRVGHDWETEQQNVFWHVIYCISALNIFSTKYSILCILGLLIYRKCLHNQYLT